MKSSSWLTQASIRKVADGFAFTEGPFWHPDQYFLFSDTPANKIYRLSPEDDSIDIFLDNSGCNHQDLHKLSDQIGSNGLAMDKNNELLVCQHGDHAIAVLDNKKELSPLVQQYNGAPFNSPNDIIVRSDGTVYFTDPPYGLAGQKLHPAEFQPHAGIYKYDYERVELLGTELQYPNGLCFSPDEKSLYISTNDPEEKHILKYKVFPNGGIYYDGIFIKENADGMTIDKQGNVYMAITGGILMVSPMGERMDFLSLPDTPSNLSWGGNEELLLVTAGSSIYFIAAQ